MQHWRRRSASAETEGSVGGDARHQGDAFVGRSRLHGGGDALGQLAHVNRAALDG